MKLKLTEFIWFNGKIIPWETAKIHVMSHALHYGSSVFEGIRCYNFLKKGIEKQSVIFRLKDHLKRLYNSAKIYRMPIIQNIDELMEACRIILRKNNLINAYIRPIVFIGDVGMGVNPPLNYTTDVVISAFPWNSYFGNIDIINKGIDVMVSSWNRVASNTIPASAKAGGNYLSSILIANEARRLGYQEGIALDIHGYVSEGAGENLFLVKDGILFTPPPCISSTLPGITRNSIIELAKEIKLEVREQVLSRESLYISDEIFMSGTASEITPVRSVDDIKIGSGKCGPITRILQKIFFGLFNGETEDKWGWLDPIHYE